MDATWGADDKYDPADYFLKTDDGMGSSYEREDAFSGFGFYWAYPMGRKDL